MKAFFNWFLSFFRNNLTVMQIAVQEIMLEVFKKRPQLKAPIANAIGQVQGIIGGNAQLSITNMPSLIKSKILGGLPTDQQVILGPVLEQMISDVSGQVNTYLAKQNITAAGDQLKVVSQVLGWVGQMAKL
jgi:hypothetical protein